MSRTLNQERLLDQTRRKLHQQHPPATEQPAAAAEESAATTVVALSAEPPSAAVTATPAQTAAATKRQSRRGRWMLLTAGIATAGLYSLQRGIVKIPLPPPAAVRPVAAVAPKPQPALQPPAATAAEKPQGILLQMKTAELETPLAARESLVEPGLPASLPLLAAEPSVSLPDPRNLSPLILAISASSLLRRTESLQAVQPAGFAIDIPVGMREVARTMEMMDASVEEVAELIFRTVQLKEGVEQTAKAD